MKNSYKYIKTSEFKDKAKNEESLDGFFLRKQCSDEVEKDPTTGALTFTISDETVDRDQDIISMKGWELDNYKDNPVVLFAHNSRDLPIARAVSTFKRDKKLKSKAEFTPKDLNPLGDTVRRMVEEGFLRATSVGMLPKDWEFAEDDEERKFGINFLKQELLEWSVVPIPANPSALIDAHAAGIDTAPIKEWAEKMLETDQALKGLSVSDIEKAWTVSNNIFGEKGFFDLGKTNTTGPDYTISFGTSSPEIKEPEWLEEMDAEDKDNLLDFIDRDGWQDVVKMCLACTHPDTHISVTRSVGGYAATCDSCDQEIGEFATFQELEDKLFSSEPKDNGASTDDPEIEFEKDVDDDEVTASDLISAIKEVAGEELARNFGRLPK